MGKLGVETGKGGGRSSSLMIRCSAVSSFDFTLTDLLNKTLGPPPVPCPCPALPPAFPAFSFSALEPLLLLLLVLTSLPTLNLRNSGDSLLAEEGSLRTTGRRTTGTAESGMRRLLQGRRA